MKYDRQNDICNTREKQSSESEMNTERTQEHRQGRHLSMLVSYYVYSYSRSIRDVPRSKAMYKYTETQIYLNQSSVPVVVVG